MEEKNTNIPNQQNHPDNHENHIHSHDDHTHELNINPDHVHCCEEHHCCHGHECTLNYINEINTNIKDSSINIPKNWKIAYCYVKELDCSHEEEQIIHAFKNKKNIQIINLNTFKHIVKIAYKYGNDKVISDTFKRLNFDFKFINDEKFVPRKKNKLEITKEYFTLFLAGFLSIIAEILDIYNGNHYLILIIAIISIYFSGFGIIKNGIFSLINKTLNINVLVSISVIAAVLINKYAEAAMVMFLFHLSEVIESYSLDKAKDSINKLLNIIPKDITILNEKKEWERKDIKDVQIGDIARVKPDEQIGLDGIIIKGESLVNQASITGESELINKTIDDQIFAGTYNQSGVIEYKITSNSNNSTIAKIIELVENAQAKKANIQKSIDNFAYYYIPIILIIAIIVGLILPLFIGDFSRWFYNALVILLIACPCALVISTPITIACALSKAAKMGILIKGGVYLEKIRKLQELGVDKTGTLTYGNAQKIDYINLEGQKEDNLSIAITLSELSNHPISKGIIKNFVSDIIDKPQINDFENIQGYGIKGKIKDDQYHIVNLKFLNEKYPKLAEIIVNNFKANNAIDKTTSILIKNGKALGYFIINDGIKEDAYLLVDEVKKAKINLFMVTGDNKKQAQKIADALDIQEIHAEQLPSSKLDIIKSKQNQNKVVAMVGDGINDAPALAMADIGISMGNLGSDIAIETADIILVDDTLNKITRLISLSKKSFVILVENITFAVGIKIIFIILALASISSMWMAVFADMGATLCVILNSLRLILWKNK